MAEISLQQKNLLMAYLLRDPVVIRQAIGKLDPAQDFTDGELSHQLLWTASSTWFEKYGKPIGREHLFAEIAKVLENSPDLGVEFVLDQLNELINDSYEPDTSTMASQYAINELLQPWLDRRISQKLDEFTAFGVDGVDQMLEELNITRAATRVTSVDKVDLTDIFDPKIALVSPAYKMSGCSVFDHMLGGMQEAHVVGVLAPSGAGKTLLALETCVETARRGLNSFFFSWEQKVQEKIQPRILSCATGTDIRKFDGVNMNDPKDQAKFKDVAKVMSVIGPRMTLLDMTTPTQGMGGILEVKNILQAEADRGVDISFVALDWLGIWGIRMMAGNPAYSAESKTTVLSMITAGVRDIANTFNCQVMLGQQINAIAGVKGVRHIGSQYDAADHKMFANEMDACLVMGQPDYQNRSQIITDKVRGAHHVAWIRTDKWHQRIHLETGEWVAIGSPKGMVFAPTSGI